MKHPLVIIGSGLAGYTLAREWRKLDRQTPLVIISRDEAGFYSKPMLSNALATGRTPQTLVTKTAAQMATELQAEVLACTEVVGVNAAEHALHLRVHPSASEAREIRYGRLVLALGADPIELPLAGDAVDRIHRVNDLDGFARFLQAIEGARQVAILGAGLIGCEFANDLLARGIRPIVIDPAPAPLSRLLPPPAALHLQQALASAGVEFRLQAAATRVDTAANGRLSLTLDKGRALEADAVLSAVGLRPRTALAQSAGVPVGRGIRVDRFLSTGVNDIHALGDCIELQHEAQAWVLPYVMPLMQQARALAATLAGTPTPVTYPAMPVTVKTPACPAVVSPVEAGVPVRWETEFQEGGCTARGWGPGGELLGFALLGTATAQRQALTRLVAARMA